MSKNKKGAKAAAEDTSWDEGLISVTVDDELWHPYLMFLVAENAEVDVQVQALESVVVNGNRKKFVYISNKDIVQTAQEDAKNAATSTGGGGKKSKQGSAPSAPRPLHVQVCEHVVSAATSGEPLSPALTARMIKYLVLKRRLKEVAEKKASMEASEIDLKKGNGDSKKKSAGTSSGRNSRAGGKKGKDTPILNELTPPVPMPTKPPTQMRKRGEEDLESKYLNDEPEHGPNCYFILTGFNVPELFKHFDTISLKINALIHVLGKVASPTESSKEAAAPEDFTEYDELNKQLTEFWPEVNILIQNSPSGSMLRDIARRDIVLKSHSLPVDEAEKKDYCQGIFDDVAESGYQLLDQYSQYEHYLEYLQIQNLPLPLEEVSSHALNPDVVVNETESTTATHPDSKPHRSTKYYNDFLKTIPEQMITLPLIVHAMVEQVSATLGESQNTKQQESDHNLSNPTAMEMTNMINYLALSEEDKQHLGIKSEPDIAEHTKASKPKVIGPGDRMGRRHIYFSKSKAEEESIVKLASQNSYFNLSLLSTPDQKAMIHALNHLVHAHENLSVTKFNHALILLSLEHVSLKTASTQPDHSYITLSPSSLPFDHPFNLEVVSKEMSLVPMSEVTTSNTICAATPDPLNNPSSYTVKLGKIHHDFTNYSVLEVFENNGLMQELLSLQHTHPYVELFQHQHSESLIIVAHSGFDGSPYHKHKLTSHTHTRVGFQNFLQYVAECYGHLIEEAIEEDKMRRKEYEEEKQADIAQKIKEAEERHHEVLTPLEEEEQPTAADAGKGKKKGEAASQRPSGPKTNPASKKSTASNINDTPMSSDHDLHAFESSIPPFEKEKRFVGYDMGDEVLLKESIHTTLFTGDGVQVHSTKHLAVNESSLPTEVSLLHRGHRLVCTQVWNPKPINSSESDTSMPVAATIPQPPPQLRSASLHASFNDTLQISCSHFGPKANGQLPFLPYRPKILDHPPLSEQQGLHPPGTQQAPSPKLSKKQQEHQQQMLEQQRALEAQLEKERQVAEAKYQQEYDTLVRNNTHQQLFIGTDFGLDVRCQVLVELGVGTEGMVASKAFVAVKQSYSMLDTALYLDESIAKERYRIYHPDGYVIKSMKDESVIIQCADGTKYQSASSKEVKLFNKRCKKDSERLRQQRPSSREEHDMPEVDKHGKRLSSAAKKMLESMEKFSPVEGKEKQKIWAVTTPTGQYYLFEQGDKTNLKETPVVTSPTQGHKETIGPSPSPSGTNSRIDVRSSSWSDSNSHILALDSLRLVKATDPVTNEVYITREDKVVLVQHPDGSYVTEFGDGTRFTASTPVDDSSLSAELLIECKGFSRVSYNVGSVSCSLTFPDGSAVECSNDGSYTVHKEEDYEVSIESSGRALYKISGASYVLDHTSVEQVFHCEDSQGNTFSLSPDGSVAMEVPNRISHKAFDPRYFLLFSDQSCFELHDHATVEEIISQARVDPEVAVVKDYVASDSSIVSTTVIEPVQSQQPLPSTVAYKHSSIVPYNLRNGEIRAPSLPLSNASTKRHKFGSLVGRGLEIGSYKKPSIPSSYIAPLALKYRQFLHMKPLDSATREKIQGIVASFITQQREEVLKSEAMQPIETRSASELESAKDLNKQFSNCDLPILYETAITSSNNKESFHAVHASISQEGLEFIKKSKAELKAAEDTRAALRDKIIPPYFESKYAKDFLPLEVPDMAHLTSQLACSRPVDTTSKSQSTLQSSSLTLTLGESDSIMQVENTSPTSKTQPSATPVPNQSHEKVSPIDTRPHNPTPMKAVASEKASMGSRENRTTPGQEFSKADFSLTSQPKANKAAIPALLGARPGEKPNMQYYTVEEPVRRKIFTSSSVVAGSKLKGFEVIPEEIDFGVVREGLAYTFKFYLKNAGIDFSRFKIKQPPPSTGIKVIYNPGPVAAGLTCSITVELFAIAVGAVGEHAAGHIHHDLEIIAQSNILRVPIRANVLTGAYYDSQPSLHKLAEGVQLAADHTRRSVTRPDKTHEEP